MYSARLLMARVRKHFEPPKKLLVSEWAAENITISSGNAAGSKYDPGFMPYQNEMMDSVVDPTIERVVIVAAARTGKTFVVQDIMAFAMMQDPCSMLYMRPIDADIKKFEKEEMVSLILNTPGMRERIDIKSETYDMKLFPGGPLRLISSNSPGKLSGYGVKLALLDEIDKYGPIPGFGNPTDLAEERTAEYALFGRKIVYISTPTVKDEPGTVDYLYEQKSDRRVYRVPCVCCGFEQELVFKHIKFDHCRETLDDVFYECQGCHAHLNDSQRLTMMRRGRWVATRPERKGFAGFKISRVYSPMATLVSLAKDFLNKKDNVLMLRQFLNDVLAEAWDENKQVKASTNDLFQRRERYLAPVPYGVGFLTMGVDVQGNQDTDKCWLEYEIKGWGRDAENWTIEHGQIPGSPTEKRVWDQLLTKINGQYLTWSGATLPVMVTGIDTQGGFTSEVKAFLKRTPPNIFGVEGKKNNPGAPLLPRRRSKRTGTWEIGTVAAKDTVFQMLHSGTPGPNCCHWPDTVDEEYFLSLLSEKKEEVITGGVRVKKYKKIRERNEVLDLMVYGYFLYTFVQRFHPGHLEASLLALEAAAVPQPLPEPAVALPPTVAPSLPPPETVALPAEVPAPVAPPEPVRVIPTPAPPPKRKPYSLQSVPAYRF